MANAKKCKKKSSVMSNVEREIAKLKTFNNKLAKLERQVKKNPNDHIAAYNLMILRNTGINGKGFSG